MRSRWSCIIDIFCFVFFLNWACCFPATSEDRNSKHQYASSRTKTCYISPSFSLISTGLFSAEMPFSPVTLDVQIGSVFHNSPKGGFVAPSAACALHLHIEVGFNSVFTDRVFPSLYKVVLLWSTKHLLPYVLQNLFPVGIQAGGVFCCFKNTAFLSAITFSCVFAPRRGSSSFGKRGSLGANWNF